MVRLSKCREEDFMVVVCTSLVVCWLLVGFVERGRLSSQKEPWCQPREIPLADCHRPSCRTLQNRTVTQQPRHEHRLFSLQHLHRTSTCTTTHSISSTIIRCQNSPPPVKINVLREPLSPKYTNNVNLAYQISQLASPRRRPSYHWKEEG